MPLKSVDKNEPFAGYRTIERIGAGGYGEVWSASAPGGLKKAIKFVYGYMDQDRASREAKALSRIKEVRHPFLLSLERIEVIDGQLIIVTELADNSLKDRFDECIAAGEKGIPRDELLSCLRDAADALDYMSETHSLQHLDVKPENLLLLAGRVKVADFGLVKNIHDVTASLHSGLTPVYAGPEVFDGRPSRFSDQYSLAIVYQEMLTGKLPFGGKSVTDLARQHMHAKPNLIAVPTDDRSTLMRALAKDPQQRFANCREFIDRLQKARRRVQVVTSDDLRESDGEVANRPNTEVLDELPLEVQQMARRKSAIPQVKTEPPVARLSPIDLSDAQPACRPTLYLGIGGTAAQILKHLRSKFHLEYGPRERNPAIQMLLLDTDCQNLMQATHGDESQALAPDETLAMPLRKPQDYRNDSRRLLQWLSRRWLYNIPRSLQTEGIRPLGRLAFVDHAPKVLQQLEEVLARLIAPETCAQAQQNCGIQFADTTPRVVLISSISGGSGSGMVLDIAYAVRHLLRKLHVTDEDILGLLTHSTGRNPSTKELATVNSFSFLTEMNHFSRTGVGYPGDAACNLPPITGDEGAFRSTYLVHLGDDLGDQDYERSTRSLADYLFLDAVSPASEFFRECRSTDLRREEFTGPEITLRTFELQRISAANDTVVDQFARNLSEQVVRRWQNVHDESAFAEDLSRKAGEMELELQPLREKLEGLLLGELSLDRDALFATVSQRRGTPFLQEIESNAGPHRITDEEEPVLGHWEAAIQQRLKRLALRQADELTKSILKSLDDPRCRVGGALFAAKWFSGHIDSLASCSRQLAGELGDHMERLRPLIRQAGEEGRRRRKAKAGEPEQDPHRTYFDIALQNLILRAVQQYVDQFDRALARLNEEILEVRRDVSHIGSKFEAPSQDLDDYDLDDEELGDEDGSSTGDPNTDLIQPITDALTDSLTTMLDDLDAVIEEQLLAGAGGLRALLTKGGVQRNRLPNNIRRTAREIVLKRLQSINVVDLLFADDVSEETAVQTVHACLRSATPRLLRCGGGKRLLMVLPKGSGNIRPVSIVHKNWKEHPSVTFHESGDLVMCTEVEDISLTQVAVTLIDAREDYGQFAARLHTRTDVKWSQLPSLLDDGSL